MSDYRLFISKAPQVMRHLVDDFDFTAVQAAAILGNVGHECAGFKLMQERRPVSGRGGYGWCQWTGPRRRAFEAWVAENGLEIDSDAANYGFLKYELTETSEHRAVDHLKRTRSLVDGVRAFEQAFLRAGVKHYPSRERYAEIALAAFNGRTDAVGADSLLAGPFEAILDERVEHDAGERTPSTAGARTADNDPAAPAEGEVSESADLETARLLANVGAMWSGFAVNEEEMAPGTAAASAVESGDAAALAGFDLARAKRFLADCMNSHPRVRYGLGSKVPFLGAVPGRDFAKVDCSGFVREAIRLSTNPRVPFPDGSVVQHDWVRAHEFERATVDDGAADDEVVRIAFLSPRDTASGIGHVLLLSAGRTLESHGGMGPNSRRWVDLPFRRNMSVYVLSRGRAEFAAELAGAASAPAAADVPTFTVRKGRRYAATIVLRGFERWASNDLVEDTLAGLGFIEVVATGAGGRRRVQGAWNRPDATVPIDSRIHDIVELPSEAGAPGLTPPASPALVGRAASNEKRGGLPPSVFTTESLPSHHDNLLLISTNAVAGTPMAVAEFGPLSATKWEPTTEGLRALNYYQRAGLVRSITPLRPKNENILAAGPAFPAAARVMAEGAFAAQASAGPPKGQHVTSEFSGAPAFVVSGASFIEIEPGQNVEALRRELARDPNVMAVSTVPVRYLASRQSFRERKGGREQGDVGMEVTPPSEADANWNLRRIRWPQARKANGFIDADAVKVAVLDTGVDERHPDLTVDAYHWRNPDIARAVSSKDIVGHGTHVSGVIAALLNGADSVNGICRCKLRVWKIFDDEPTYADGGYHYFVNPILYRRALAALVDDPVDVINLSIGGPGAPDATESFLFEELIAAGTTVCAAMGNDRQYGSPITYPAALPNLIAVGATGRDDRVTVFSNAGNHIAVVAPGKAIWSTLPTYPGQTGFHAETGPSGRPRQGKPLRREVNYDAWDGTSMATPHISGCAALLIARSIASGGKKPKPADVRSAMMKKSDKVAGMAGAGFSTDYGAGRVNLEKLLGP